MVIRIIWILYHGIGGMGVCDLFCLRSINSTKWYVYRQKHVSKSCVMKRYFEVPRAAFFLTLFYTKGSWYLMLIGSTRIVLAILQPPFGLADPIKKKVGIIKWAVEVQTIIWNFQTVWVWIKQLTSGFLIGSSFAWSSQLNPVS